MKKKQHITAFYLETLLMIVVFISIILVLTRVFGSARARSAQAKKLTAAVTLAQNAAEAVSGANTPQELLEILNRDGNAILQEDAATGAALVTAAYDSEMRPVQIAAQADTRPEGGADTGNVPVGSADLLRQGADLIVETTWTPVSAEEDPASSPGEAAEILQEPASTEGAAGAAGLAADGTGMIESVVTVFDGHTGKAVYALNTSVYVPEKGE